jgi:hypothetical protein
MTIMQCGDLAQAKHVADPSKPALMNLDDELGKVEVLKQWERSQKHARYTTNCISELRQNPSAPSRESESPQQRSRMEASHKSGSIDARDPSVNHHGSGCQQTPSNRTCRSEYSLSRRNN